MTTNMKRFFGLGIALCLGLTSACVRVDVSVRSQGNNHPLGPPFQPDNKLPISIEKLKKRHAGINKECYSSLLEAIDREKQQTEAWCWAASTRIVMEYHNKKELKPTALQCDIVKNVLNPWLGGVNCCLRQVTTDFIDAPAECVQGGWPSWVLDKYQFNYEWIDGALDDWEALKGEICKIGPFILVIKWRDGGRHVFIVTGYSERPTKVVTMYDPYTADFQTLDFDEFIGAPSKGRDRLLRFSHDRNYVQIMPEDKD